MADSSALDSWQLADTEVFLKYGDAFVPRRREQVGAVCDLLEDIPVRHVLDLCCGEGRLSREYLRRHEDSRVTVLDSSAKMLAISAERLRPFGSRYDQVQANIEDLSWRTGVSYGGVMTSLAVHHLDGKGKQALYRDVHEMLVPGGVLVMADIVEPAGASTRRLAGDHWDEAVLRASEQHFGGDEAAVVFEETEWNHYRLENPDPVDKPSTVVQHLDWLRAAGFVEVDLAWMYAGHGLFTAKRSAD